jgi:3-oxoacyl-(acyl-carrier-protein) synthase
MEQQPIAVIGMGCRLPGASTPEEYWQLLATGSSGITRVPADRWDADELYHPTVGFPGTMVAKQGGFLTSVDDFDPDPFGIPAREAQLMDPQQRLLLEVGFEALQDAGINSQEQSARTGKFRLIDGSVSPSFQFLTPPPWFAFALIISRCVRWRERQRLCRNCGFLACILQPSND